MTTRPVFAVSTTWPYYRQISTEFEWHPGFAVSQKRKNIAGLHRAFERTHPGETVLEVSSKSMQEYGPELSAFNLMKELPGTGRRIPVECAFQGGKVFSGGGPYTDLYDARPGDARRDERLRNSGRLTGFVFAGTEFPTEPKTLFYDWLYMNALLENRELSEALCRYDAFTDIEFNPQKSLNCQARAAAVFAALARLGRLDDIVSPETLKKLYTDSRVIQPVKPEQPEPQQEAPEVSPGMTLHHAAYGEGTITAVSRSTVTISFREVGEKKLGLEWVMKNCRIG